MKRISFAGLLTMLSMFLLFQGCTSTDSSKSKVTPEEARAIAKEAYIYGFPVVDNYRVMYYYFVDKNTPAFKAPWNQIINIARVYTPKDTTIQTPNSDTPYSFVGADLRTEPLVFTLPEVEKDRYYSVQFTDAYTFNFGYAGTRTTGNDSCKVMLAGPGWKGEVPAGIKKVIRSETDFNLIGFRTQLFNPADIDNVKKIQAGYKVQTLSEFLGKPQLTAAPAVDFIKPLSPEAQKTSLQFYNILNFALKYCPTDSSETELMKRFAKIDIGAGLDFDTTKFSPEILTAIKQGRADAFEAFEAGVKELNEDKLNPNDLWGDRESMKNNYLNRWLGTIGIYANSAKEAMYPFYRVDNEGNALSGANKYTMHFAPNDYPPVNAFWSLTMYQLPQSWMVANPINRYLINSPMLPNMKKDADGGLTLYIQHDSPGNELESNWLPAPEGPFSMYLRLYWPKEAALDGSWKKPPLNIVK